MSKKLKHIGYFSYGKEGTLCLHQNVKLDPKLTKKVLDKGDTGGPYTIIKAYIKVKK